MFKTRSALLAVIAALALVGCDNDSGKTTKVEGGESTTTSAGDSSSSSSSGGGLAAKLITQADLPSGYTIEESSSEPDAEDEPAEGEEEGGASEFCAELESFEDDYKATEEAEVDFGKGSAANEQAMEGTFGNETLMRFDSEDEANEAFDAFRDAAGKCKEFEETDADGTYKGTFSPIEFPKLGEETFAVHFAVEGGGGGFSLEFAGDLVIVRDGDVIMLVGTFGLGQTVPVSELESIAKAAAGRL